MTSAPPATYRMMTYNVHRCVGLDRRHAPERIAGIIADFQPDIIALQELEVNHQRTARLHQPRRLADILKMDFHYHPARQREEVGFGNAILTRLPMRKVQSEILPTLSFPRLQRRGALWASVRMGAVEVQVINTHLGLVHGERVLQASALCSDTWLGHPECRARPRILCGDFNATPLSPVYRLFKGTLRDAQRLHGEKPRRTWPSFCPLVRYDHVFVCPRILVKRVTVPRNKATLVASDHLPVIMDFEIEAC